MTLAGFPAASTRGGTALVTMLPAPMTAPSPISTPARMIAFAPIQQPRRKITCLDENPWSIIDLSGESNLWLAQLR